MKKIIGIGLCLLFVGFIRAEEEILTPQDIQDRIDIQDKLLQKKEAQLKEFFGSWQNMLGQIRDEKILFERALSKERKEFLTELKTMPDEKRKELFAQFNAKQDRQRQESHYELAEKRWRFEAFRDDQIKKDANEIDALWKKLMDEKRSGRMKK